MNYSNAEKVEHFQEEVLGNIKPFAPRMPADPLREIAYLTEEISELAVAMQKNDIVDAADALIDLLYFAYGLGFKMGLPVDECFQIVHLANMRKSRGLTKRGLSGDAAKPADWINPRQHLAALLDAPK